MKSVQCPNCDSFKTGPNLIGLNILIIGIVIDLIGLIIWPLLIIGVPLVIVGFFMAMSRNMFLTFSKEPYKEKYKCTNCKEDFYVWFKMPKRFFLFRTPQFCPMDEIPKGKLDLPVAYPLKRKKDCKETKN